MKRATLFFILILIFLCFCFCCIGCEKVNDVDTDNNPSSDVVKPPAKAEFVVNFYTAGEELYLSMKVVEGDKVSQPTAPEKKGFIFLGWYEKTALDKAWDFNQSINSSVDLYANWEEVVFIGVGISENSTHTTSFALSQYFNYEGLIVERKFSDGSTMVISEEYYEVFSDNYNGEKAGTYEIIVSTAYGDLSYFVIVEGIVELHPLALSDSLVFVEGDKISIEGLQAEIIFANGTKEKVPNENLCFVSKNSGTEKVTAVDGKDSVCVYLSYMDDFFFEYEVDVYDVAELVPNEIFIKNLPYTLDFLKNTEFNYGGLEVEKTTNLFGERRFEMSANEYDVDFSQCDKTVAGQYDVIVVAKKSTDVKTSYKINVVEVFGEIVAIEAIPLIDKYYRTEKFNLDLAESKKIYEEGAIGLNKGEYAVDLSEFDAATLGVYKIRVYLIENEDIFTEFSVEVVENPLEGIFYAIEGITPVLSKKIIAENGVLNIYEYNYSDNDWLNQPVASVVDFTRTATGISYTEKVVDDFSADRYFDYDFDKTAISNSEQEYFKLHSDDLMLSFDNIYGFFLLVKKGNSLEKELLDEINSFGNLYLTYDDEKQEGVLLTSNDVFYEDTIIYLR